MQLLVEGLRGFASRRLSSVIAVAVAGSACLAIGVVFWLGEEERLEAERALDSGISRVVEVRGVDGVSIDLDEDLVEVVRNLAGVEAVVTLDRVRDMHTGTEATPLPLVALDGDTGFTGTYACGTGLGVASVDPAADTAAPRAAYDQFGTSVGLGTRRPHHPWFGANGIDMLLACPPSGLDDPARMLVFVAAVPDITPATQALRELLAPVDHRLVVRSAEDLVEYRDRLNTELVEQRGNRLRNTLLVYTLAILGFQGALTALRRSELGRQRALGASRLQLVSLLMGGALWSTLAGGLVATLGSLASTPWISPDLGYEWIVPGTVLVLVATAAGLAPVAAYAAFTDPARALRVP